MQRQALCTGPVCLTGHVSSASSASLVSSAPRHWRGIVVQTDKLVVKATWKYEVSCSTFEKEQGVGALPTAFKIPYSFSVFGAARDISPQAQPPPCFQVAAGLSSGASTLEGGCELYSGPQEERVLRTPEEGFSSPEPSPGHKPSFPSDLGLHQTLPHFMRKRVCRRLEQADTTGQRTPTSAPQDPSPVLS